jgi:hypothetical protein
MDILTAIFGAVYGMLSREFTMFGFEISFMQVIIWKAVAVLLIWFVWRIME